MTGYEFEKFVEKMQPDLVGSGIKEKYVFQKMGVPFRQMHSWDYSGPYHGYDGFAIFARDMDMAINSPVWSLAKAPWKVEAERRPSPPNNTTAGSASSAEPAPQTKSVATPSRRRTLSHALPETAEAPSWPERRQGPRPRTVP